MKGNDIKKENRGVKDKKARNCGFLVIINHELPLYYICLSIWWTYFSKNKDNLKKPIFSINKNYKI